MSSLSVACRLWDLCVTHSILTGWWLSRVNTLHTSLLCAWIVFLCDLVYIMDALARASKNSHGSSTSSSFFSFIISAGGSWTIFATVISALKFATFVPFHVLVILELDISCFYLVICALRFVRLLQTGRIYGHVIWTISKLLKDGGLVAKYKRRSSQKASKKDELKRKIEKSTFLEHIRKLQAEEMEPRGTIKETRCVI